MSLLYGLLTPLIPIVGAFIAVVVVRSRRAKVAATSEVTQDPATLPRWVTIALWCFVALVGLLLIPTVAILVLAR